MKYQEATTKMKTIILLMLLIPLSLSAQITGGSGIENEFYIPALAEGTIGFKDSTVVITIASADTYTKVTNAGNNLFAMSSTAQNCLLASDGIVVEKNGYYNIDYRLSISTANNKDIKATLCVNDTTECKACAQFTSTGSADIVPLVSFGKAHITDAPDTLYISIKNLDDDADVTVYCGAIRVIKTRP